MPFDLDQRVTAPILERLLDLPEPVSREVAVRRNIRVPMPDGVHLATDHFRPPGDEPLPAVIFRTPYRKESILGNLWAILLARQGFQVVVQDTRGQFASEGRFDAFRQERADGLATAAWVRRQPWCDGILATAGPSYLGHTQWCVAPYLDEPLAAMCPAVTTSNFAELFYPGGAFNLRNLLGWSSMMGVQERSRLRVALSRQGSRVAQAMSHLPLAEADNAAIGKPEPFWRTVTDHAEAGDDYWDEIDNTPALKSLTTPVSMVTGWWDLLLPGQLRDFEVLQEGGCTRRITIGPWDHLRAARSSISDSVSWLAAHLHGDTSAANRSTVHLYLQNAGQWLDFEHWPPPQSTPTNIHLRASGGLDWDSPEDTAERGFTYNPADPTPTVGGAVLDAMASRQRDNASVESRSDVLVFTGEPLTENLDLIGPVSASIVVSTDTGFGDLFVRLCDVDRKGVSRNICDGIVRLRGQQEPGAVTVEMHPTGYRIGRGHRVRIQVSGGGFPNHARNNGTGEPLATAKRTTPVTYRILPGSSVTLPVMSPKARSATA